MSESSPDASESTMYAQPWAIRLGFAVIAALTLILGLGFFDNGHRKELETVAETTSVGDTRFFQAPADVSRLPAVGAVLDGQPLYVAEMKPVEVRDTHTRRAGTDAERGLAIYELSPAATDEERRRVGTKHRAFLLKTAIGQYVAARPAEGK